LPGDNMNLVDLDHALKLHFGRRTADGKMS
jgi:hypothetical protein